MLFALYWFDNELLKKSFLIGFMIGKFSSCFAYNYRITHTVFTILRKRAAPRPRAMWAIREKVYSKHYLLLNRSLTREAHLRVLNMDVVWIILFY